MIGKQRKHIEYCGGSLASLACTVLACPEHIKMMCFTAKSSQPNRHHTNCNQRFGRDERISWGRAQPKWMLSPSTSQGES